MMLGAKGFLVVLIYLIRKMSALCEVFSVCSRLWKPPSEKLLCELFTRIN